MNQDIPEAFHPILLDFVRRTIRADFEGRELPPIPTLARLEEPGACFVTLKCRVDDSLRGCIGTIEAFESLGENLRRNALNAAFGDPRFPPLEPDELDETAIELSILSAPQAIAAPEAFQTGKHGIILACAGRRSVFLPQVATEQGWNRETTLDFLARKAGLPETAWRRPDARLFIFSAEIIGPDR